MDASNWLTSGVSGVRTELATLIEFEWTCSNIVDVSPLLVPGLLQTADYIRAVMADVDTREIERSGCCRLRTCGGPPP